MWSVAAPDVEALKRVGGSIHDAYYEGIDYDPSRGVVVLAFQQEGLARRVPR